MLLYETEKKVNAGKFNKRVLGRLHFVKQTHLNVVSMLLARISVFLDKPDSKH